MTHSLADVLKRADPARAHRLAPENGRITALLAEKRFAENPSPRGQAPVTALARLAVQQDPTGVGAVSTLGFQAQLRGETARAGRLFNYAEALSRRHLQTQLWAVEAAVARGNVPGALRHYDIALRTSLAAQNLLFPVLSTAIDNPPVRSGLASIMAKQPEWATTFIAYLASARNDARSTASLFAALKRVGVPVSPDQASRVIDRLIEANALVDAWRFYVAVHPGADFRRSRNPEFAIEPGATSLFDWKVSDDASVTTSIQRGDNGGVFDFSVPAGGGGALLEQMQILPPGRYRLVGHSIGIEQLERSLPYWSLTCRNGRELGRVIVPNSAQANGMFAGRLDVPAGCPVQLLSLIAPPSDETAGMAGQIDRVQMTPLR